MIVSDIFQLVDSYNWTLNEILEEAEFCLQRRTEMIEYNNPICKLLKVEKYAKEKIYIFQIYEEK